MPRVVSARLFTLRAPRLTNLHDGESTGATRGPSTGRLARLFSGLLAPLLTSMLIATSAMAAQGIIDTPRGTTVQMRSGPADAFDTLRILRPGAAVDLLGDDPAGMWVHVRDSSGTEGWIPQSALATPRDQKPTQDTQRSTTGRNADRPDYIRRDASNHQGYGQTHAQNSGQNYGRTYSQTNPRDGYRPADATNESTNNSGPARETLYVDSPSAGSLNLRQGPGTDTAILATLPHGSAVTILGGGAPWRRVRAAGGQIGYVHDSYLSMAPRVAAAPDPVQPIPGRVLETLYVNAPRYGALNLRQGPGTNYDIAETMPQGTRVEILDGGTPTWRFMRSENGTLGFAHKDYLSPTRPAAARVARDEYRDGRRVIRVTPQELPGLLAACAFSGNLDRCMVRQLERRDRR